MILALLGVLLAARAEAQDNTADLMTLKQAIAISLEHNPSLVVEKEKLRDAEAGYLVARSGLLPKVSGSIYYNRLDPNRLSFAGFTGTTAPTLFAGEAFANLRVQQLLLDGRTRPTREAAQIGIEARQFGVSSSRSETVFAVTLAYTRLVEASDLIAVAEEALKRQVAFKELAEVFHQAGKTSRLDVLKAESQRVSAERTLIAARENETLAQILLRQTLGTGMDQPLRAVSNLNAQLIAAPSEEAVLAEAAKQNPRLRSLRAQEAQTEAQVRATKGEHLPSLSLQGSYGLRHRDIGGAEDEYAVGLFLDIPIFTGLATTGRVQQMEARTRQAQGIRRGFENQIYADVRVALTGWRIAMADAKSTATSVEVNREALVAATSLYESGKVTVLEVLTSQTELLRAEASHVQALGDYAIARAKVRRVTGSTQYYEGATNE